MAFVNLPFGVKVEVAWETGSGVAVCIHFVSKTTPAAITAAELVAINSAFDGWRTAIRPVQPNVVTIAGIRSIDWSVPDGATVLTVPSASVAGSNANPILPLNVAICASHYTGLTGRSRRGRNYIPGIGENDVATGDVILAAARTVIVGAYQALRTDLLAAGFVQVVASFHANGAPRANGQGTAVLTTQIDQYSDSQRRRLAGRGA